MGPFIQNNRRFDESVETLRPILGDKTTTRGLDGVSDLGGWKLSPFSKKQIDDPKEVVLQGIKAGNIENEKTGRQLLANVKKEPIYYTGILSSTQKQNKLVQRECQIL